MIYYRHVSVNPNKATSQRNLKILEILICNYFNREKKGQYDYQKDKHIRCLMKICIKYTILM